VIFESEFAEAEAVFTAAKLICAAARTAPKACGVDHLETAILTGEDKDRVAAEMRAIGEEFGETGRSFVRDAENVERSSAVVLIGAKYEPRALGEKCKLCGFADCAQAVQAGAACAFTAMDLGIALGSAVSLIADARVDNRMMFTIGKAVGRLGLLGEYRMVVGLPLSVSGKSIFFDRAPV